MITLERKLKASLDDVWELWTTAEGIESWWGPDGFTTRVDELDVRRGGAFRYTMTATGKNEVEFMKREGLPLSSKVKATYTEVAPKRRLAFTQLADFLPGVKPFEMTNVVELESAGGEVRMTVTVDGIRDPVFGERAKMGWESQLGRLEKKLTSAA
jgi:uncharacterized protein YndB with AHSA1/START domain